MKNKINLLFFFIFSKCLSQDCMISYDLFINSEKRFVAEMFSKNQLDDKLKFNSLSFELFYNDNLMKFSMNVDNSILNDDISLIKDVADFKGKAYYKNTSSDFVYAEIDKYASLTNFISKKRFIYDWKISNEKKIIQGYECIKATCSLKVDYGDGEINELYPIVAWFTKAIPISFGPKAIGGLPGMILELEQNLVIFKASKINLNFYSNKELPNDKEFILESRMYEIIENKINSDTYKCNLKSTQQKKLNDL